MKNNIKHYIDDFCDYFMPIEKGRSQTTIKNYRYRLELIAKKMKLKSIEDITMEVISEFRKQMTKGKRTLPTINNYLLAVKSFLKYLQDKDIKALAPNKINLAKVPDGDIDFLTHEEVELLLSAPRSSKNITETRNKAILEFAFASGARVSELVNLRTDSLNLKNNEAKIVNGKGGKSAIVFFTDRTKEHLENYLNMRKDKSPNLFVGHGSKNYGNKLTVRSIQQIIKFYANYVGIKKKVTPHSLRRAYACGLLKDGVSVYFVQKLLRHSSISSTEHYLTATNQELKAIYNQYKN